MKLGLAILPAAITDILVAVQWYEAQRTGLGAEFVSEVNDAIDSLAERALIFRVRYRRLNVRWIFPRRFP